MTSGGGGCIRNVASSVVRYAYMHQTGRFIGLIALTPGRSTADSVGVPRLRILSGLVFDCVIATLEYTLRH
jgi:hypothetical protein